MTKSEFEGFTREVISRFEDLSKQLKEMLPREIYEVRQRQVVDDTLEIAQRISTAEKAIAELSSQLSTTRLATVQQLNTDARGIEQKVGAVRYESLDRIYDLLKYFLFTVAGAVISYLLTRGF